jgi:hypothetical protein
VRVRGDRLDGEVGRAEALRAETLDQHEYVGAGQVLAQQRFADVRAHALDPVDQPVGEDALGGQRPAGESARQDLLAEHVRHLPRPVGPQAAGVGQLGGNGPATVRA